VRKFYSAYAVKMGMDPSNSQDPSQKAKAMFSQYKGIWTEIAAKMQNVKGISREKQLYPGPRRRAVQGL
jgi:hypothetical protein